MRRSNVAFMLGATAALVAATATAGKGADRPATGVSERSLTAAQAAAVQPTVPPCWAAAVTLPSPSAPAASPALPAAMTLAPVSRSGGVILTVTGVVGEEGYVPLETPCP